MKKFCSSIGVTSTLHTPWPEESLLTSDMRQRWGGLPVQLCRAAEKVTTYGDRAPHPVVAIILGGQARAEITSRSKHEDLDVGHGSVGVFGPQLDVERSAWQCEPGVQRLIVGIEPSAVAELGGQELLGDVSRLHQRLHIRDPQLSALLAAMGEELLASCPRGRLYAQSLSMGLLSYLRDSLSQAARPFVERGRLDASQLAGLRDYVQEHLANELGLEALSAQVGLSRFVFLRMFKNTVGITPHRWLLQQRVEAAKRLLRQSALPVAEVALAVGFSSQSHLSTVFKQHTGFTPREARLKALQ